MSSISIKGIVIAALFDFIVVGVQGFIKILIISKATGAATGAEMTAVFEASPALRIAVGIWNFVFIVVVLTAGGYLAAKIARKGPLINGTLSASLCMLGSLYSIITLRPEHWVGGALTTALLPLLGLLGGYLYLRRSRNFLQVLPGAGVAG